MKLIISTMKNEAPFLLEWIAYHQAVGFDHFLIYTNDCTDGTDFMLERLTELGVVTHRRNKVLKRGPHKSALKHAMKDPLFAEAEWIYVADVDEFLNVQAGAGKVDDLIAAYPNADAIPVTWRMFSSNGAVDFPFGGSMETFTDAEAPELLVEKDLRFVKTMFKNDARIVKLGLHAPDYAEDVSAQINWGSKYIEANPDGQPRRPAHVYGYEIAQVNHYAVRSVDAYLLKRDRGRANHVSEVLGDAYWVRWNRGGTKDVSIQRHLADMELRLTGLRDDPELAFFERAGIAMNELRLSKLKADPDYAALREKLIAGSDVKPTAPFAFEPVVVGELRSSTPTANKKTQMKSTRRHENRRNMLGLMPKNGKCAEIGVWQGRFSLEILDITLPQELVLIDPWGLIADGPKQDWTHSKHENRDQMDEMYMTVQSEFSGHENVTIRKGFSADVLADYPDDYFDWVYIDGNHQYEFVKKDIELCYRKVKNGGIIAGDDFLWKRDGRKQVKEAVQDTMAALGVSPETHLSRMGQQFMIKVER